jgi:hypothetical protein
MMLKAGGGRNRLCFQRVLNTINIINSFRNFLLYANIKKVLQTVNYLNDVNYYTSISLDGIRGIAGDASKRGAYKRAAAGFSIVRGDADVGKDFGMLIEVHSSR